MSLGNRRPRTVLRTGNRFLKAPNNSPRTCCSSGTLPATTPHGVFRRPQASVWYKRWPGVTERDVPSLGLSREVPGAGETWISDKGQATKLTLLPNGRVGGPRVTEGLLLYRKSTLTGLPTPFKSAAVRPRGPSDVMTFTPVPGRSRLAVRWAVGLAAPTGQHRAGGKARSGTSVQYLQICPRLQGLRNP